MLHEPCNVCVCVYKFVVWCMYGVWRRHGPSIYWAVLRHGFSCPLIIRISAQGVTVSPNLDSGGPVYLAYVERDRGIWFCASFFCGCLIAEARKLYSTVVKTSKRFWYFNGRLREVYQWNQWKWYRKEGPVLDFLLPMNSNYLDLFFRMIALFQNAFIAPMTS